MILSRAKKREIIDAILADVPAKGYEDQIRALALKWAESQLPPAVGSLWRHPQLREWVKLTHCGRDEYHFTIPLRPDSDIYWIEDFGEFEGEYQTLYRADMSQSAARHEIREKVKTLILGFKTDKQLIERAPEFAKYLPQVKTPATNLPVVTGVIADLMRAGWAPKTEAV